jgi:glucose-6-phosphate isomerase/transaldolase/glucose-6-phosphate isomerase
MKETLINYYPGNYHQIVEIAWKKTQQDDVARRIRAKDYKLWSPSPEEIVNRLGWLDAPGQILKKADYIRETIAPLAAKKIKDVILLGMGGSGLAAEVFNKVFGAQTGYPQLTVLDTTNPAIISNIAQKIDWDKTIFIVSSKSGTTMEITSLFHFFYNEARKIKGGGAGEHFIFITDEGSPLAKTVRELSPFHVFLNNPDIGGRYSALSFFGIVPAAIIGIDVNKLLHNAQTAAGAADETGIMLGAALGALACQGRDKLTLYLPWRWKSFGDWLEQLIAESTGKEGKGILPVLDEPEADVSLYENDRVFVFFQNENDNFSRIKDLNAAGHPVVTLKIREDFDLASQMYIWEMATAVAAYFLGVNPFDQPDVEATKIHTRTMIEAYKDKRKEKEKEKENEEKPVIATAEGHVYGDTKEKTISEALNNFLMQKKMGDYTCLQIYLNASAEVDSATAKLRAAIFKKYKLPVTCGYGPRYLHSTGQLHKGGANCGLFIQLTEENLINIPIPDELEKESSSLSFGELLAAQAQGDWQALKEKGRRIIRIHCPNDAAAFLKKLAAAL